MLEVKANLATIMVAVKQERERHGITQGHKLQQLLSNSTDSYSPIWQLTLNQVKILLQMQHIKQDLIVPHTGGS